MRRSALSFSPVVRGGLGRLLLRAAVLLAFLGIVVLPASPALAFIPPDTPIVTAIDPFPAGQVIAQSDALRPAPKIPARKKRQNRKSTQ